MARKKKKDLLNPVDAVEAVETVEAVDAVDAVDAVEAVEAVEKKIYVANGKSIISRKGIIAEGDEVESCSLSEQSIITLLKSGHLIEK